MIAMVMDAIRDRFVAMVIAMVIDATVSRFVWFTKLRIDNVDAE